MIKRFAVSIMLLMIWGMIIGASVRYFNEPTDTNYQKGYNKGYADAIVKYAEDNAKRDSIAEIRHNQFLLQMQRLAIAIENYKKATKNIQGG